MIKNTFLLGSLALLLASNVPASANQSPIGRLDVANCEVIAGWAYDLDNTSQSVAIHIYADGPAGSGSFVTSIVAAGSRPDVEKAFGITGDHGYTTFTPNSLKDGKEHDIYLYAIDSNGGSNSEIGKGKISNCLVGRNQLPVISFEDLDKPNVVEDTVTLKVNAVDPDGSISKVEFLVDGKLIYTDDVLPYEYSWKSEKPGNYTFTAVAHDFLGASKETQPLKITVGTVDGPSPVYEPGLKALERPETLPLWLPQGTVTKQIASYDPTGRNYDGGFKKFKRMIDANGEWVIFDEYGSGVLPRMQMNMWDLGVWGYAVYPNARIKFYFDNEANPRLDVKVDEFFGVEQKFAPPSAPPLSFFDESSRRTEHNHRFGINYYPFTFRDRLKVTLSNMDLYAAGYLDRASCESFAGWAVDPDNVDAEIPVHVYIDGPAGVGKFLMEIYPNTKRPEVNDIFGNKGVYGFTIGTPAEVRDGKEHKLYFYAIDTDRTAQRNGVLLGSPATVKCEAGGANTSVVTNVAWGPHTSAEGLIPNPWYQFTYLKFPKSIGIQSWSYEGGSSVVDAQWNNLGSDPKSQEGNVTVEKNYSIPRGSSVAVFEHSGRGSIASIKFSVSPYNRNVFNKLRLQMYWDDSQSPAVDMPLGSFFGGTTAEDTIPHQVYNLRLNNLFYGFNGANSSLGTFYSYWPMPFWSKARIVIVNETGADVPSFTSEVKYKPSSVLSYDKKKAGHFAAKRTIDLNPTGSKPFATAFEESGRGKVVGLMFYSNDKYVMDGDEFTYIDDSNTPQIHGDGTEDDHNQGWGGDNYQKALWGGVFNGYVGGYRTYFPDPYVFNKSIQINYEYFTIPPDYVRGQAVEAIVYYYKDPERKSNLFLTDQLNVGNASSETSHSYIINGQTWSGSTSSSYDGYDTELNYNYTTDNGRAFTGYSEFTAKIRQDNGGVKLRRRTNRYNNNIQTADVYVDGRLVAEGPWYIFDHNPDPDHAFIENDYEIPAAYTKNKKSIRIRIAYRDAADQKTGISEYYYWIYSYGPDYAAPSTTEQVKRGGSANGVANALQAIKNIMSKMMQRFDPLR